MANPKKIRTIKFNKLALLLRTIGSPKAIIEAELHRFSDIDSTGTLTVSYHKSKFAALVFHIKTTKDLGIVINPRNVSLDMSTAVDTQTQIAILQLIDKYFKKSFRISNTQLQETAKQVGFSFHVNTN